MARLYFRKKSPDLSRDFYRDFSIGLLNGSWPSRARTALLARKDHDRGASAVKTPLHALSPAR